MPVTSSPASIARARRLTTTFYLYAFLDEFVLLYPVYALLFTDTGLSVAEISSLFVIWSLTGIVLEVPSGVWADAVSRRLLLAGAPLLGAAGFGLWVAAPSYWAFALGFVLWGARGALQSGASEALLYDELDRLGLADRYGRVIGRASTVSLLAALLAIAVAAPVFAIGGYPAVGIASVLASLLCAVVALALPEHRVPAPVVTGPDPTLPDGPVPFGHQPGTSAATRSASTTAAVAGEAADQAASPAADVQPAAAGQGTAVRERVAPAAALVATGVTPAPVAEPGEAGYLAILRVALAEARHSRAVRRTLLLLPALAGIWGGLEEYVPLLAGEVAPASGVPLLVLLVWAGVMLGGLLTPLGQRLSARRLAASVGIASIALAVGALADRPAGFVLVAAAFCLLQMVSLVADARLQESIGGPARATVTSLAGLGTELVTIAVYGGYALASTVAGHGVVFGLLALPYLVLAVGLGRAATRRARRRTGADAVPE